MEEFNFEFDSVVAQKADRIANSMDSAAYVGEFKSASLAVSSGGAKALEFVFSADEGGSAVYKVWFKSKTETGGKPLDNGMALINSIMAILGIHQLRSTPGMVKVWENGAQVEKEGTIYPSLIGQKIGVVNRNILKDRMDGNGFRTDREMVLVYDARTSLTASEKLSNETSPKKLAKVLKGLKDKDERKLKSTGSAGALFGSLGGDESAPEL